MYDSAQEQIEFINNIKCYIFVQLIMRLMMNLYIVATFYQDFMAVRSFLFVVNQEQIRFIINFLLMITRGGGDGL